MAIIKCKMCGGDIVLNEEKTFGTCEYCGSTMTLPKVSDEQRAARFNRGNHFRRQGEFDKALAVYETIVREDDSDAEAHWCCALCRFGIEYVEDPNTFEYLPTCHRASFDSFLEDVDYLAALEHSDGITRRQYQKDAAKIAEVQKGILAASQNEEPFDVFICYKETDDATKERTRDSIDAQEIYYQLTQEGYRVFFSRITLEDKVGTEYEPYIFAALNSAKVMVALGSKPEYFNAVWVKNEWSRFLAMMRKDRSKLLLPCYKNMDPYDLPEQLGVLQSYDMAKIGFIQDLIRGVKKVLAKDEVKSAESRLQQTIFRETGGSGPNISALLKRGNMALEDQAWEKAKEFFDQILNMDAENYGAYLGLVMADANTSSKRVFQTAYIDHRVQDSGNLRRARQFAKAEQSAWWSKLDADRKAADAEKAEKKRIEEERRKAEEQKREEAARKAEEDRKRKEEAQAQEEADKVIAAIRAKTAEKEATLEAQLAAARQRAAQLTELCASFDEIQAQEFQRRGWLEQCEQKKNQLQNRRAALGVFSGKEKKQIESELMALKRQAEQVKAIHSNLVKQLQGLETKAQAEQERIKAVAAVSELEQSIFERKATQSRSFSYEQAIRVLQENQRVHGIVYQKAAELRSDIIRLLLTERIESGSAITFGNYPTNRDAAPEPIEWQILKRETSRILLISKYALDCRQYNSSSTYVTWETCTLRKWLNSDFLNAAFTAEEQNLISTVTLSAEKNPRHDINSGKSTQDRVFLLSISEVAEYFDSYKARRCAPTNFALAQGTYTDEKNMVDGRPPCWWWLRSPGYNSDNAAYVNYDGSVVYYGHSVNRSNGAIRPALWIDLGS